MYTTNNDINTNGTIHMQVADVSKQQLRHFWSFNGTN